MLPNGWEITTVGKACAIRNNLRQPISSEERDLIQGQFPYFGPTGILGSIDHYKIDEEFVLIGEDGDHFLKFKDKEMTLLFSGKANVNNHAHIVTNSEQCLAQWFHLFFMHRDLTSFLTRQGAKRYKLTKASLEKLPLTLPPLSEQKKIAQILSTWDKAITTTEQLIANSQQQKKALMQQLLTGKKRLLNDSGVRFSGEWIKKKISDIGNVITGNTPPKNDDSNYGGSISWATAEDFKNKYITSTKIRLSQSGSGKSRVVPAGSVLITCIASIGKNAIAKESMATNQQINSVIVDEKYCNEFFYYLIEFNTDLLLSYAGTTAVPIINKSTFEKIAFYFPSLNEQQKIASVLSSADREIELLKSKLTSLKQEKKALMQQLLTGKRRVLVNTKEKEDV